MATKRNRKPAPQSKAQKERQQQKAQAYAEKQEKREQRSKIIVTVFAIVIALAMALPSLVSLIGSSSSSSGIDYSDLYEVDGSGNISMSFDSIAAGYEPYMDELLAKLEKKPNNIERLQNVANEYFNWGYLARYYAQTDEQSAKVTELFENAISYYDQIIEKGKGDAVTSAQINSALSRHYMGDTETALANLEAYSQEVTDSAGVWANLGLLYEASEKEVEARTSYEKAIELDPKDETGYKSYAEGRIEALDAAAIDTSVLGDAEGTSESLADTLASSTGTGY